MAAQIAKTTPKKMARLCEAFRLTVRLTIFIYGLYGKNVLKACAVLHKDQNPEHSPIRMQEQCFPGQGSDETQGCYRVPLPRASELVGRNSPKAKAVRRSIGR